MRDGTWPELEWEEWRDTCETLHLWCQVVGKVRLACMPWINHSWHVPLYVTVRGLTTSPVPHGRRAFEIELDLVEHHLRVLSDDGRQATISLPGLSVAEFHDGLLGRLEALGMAVEIWPIPVELPDPVVAFPDDHDHAAYDPDAVDRFRRVLLNVHRVLTVFRARYTGKVSPVHLFWGAFDLAVTRFSGRPAPLHPAGAPHLADWVMQEAYSHEVSSAGFWPGAGLGEAAFYSYAYPEPEGYRQAPVRPASAFFHEELGEYILPYEAVRSAADPDRTLLDFLDSTWRAAAERGGWDRERLEANPGSRRGRGPRS